MKEFLFVVKHLDLERNIERARHYVAELGEMVETLLDEALAYESKIEKLEAEMEEWRKRREEGL